jgi:hypothetical protein
MDNDTRTSMLESENQELKIRVAFLEKTIKLALEKLDKFSKGLPEGKK